MILFQAINSLAFGAGAGPIPSLLTGTARYFFLMDHYISGNYVFAGETHETFDGIIPVDWVPSMNVDPLNFDATWAFYNSGPQMTGVIRTHYELLPVTQVVTHWYEVTPNHWALTGLGADQTIFPPKLAYIGRIE